MSLFLGYAAGYLRGKGGGALFELLAGILLFVASLGSFFLM